MVDVIKLGCLLSDISRAITSKATAVATTRACHTGLGIYFASKALIALWIALVALFWVLLLEIGHFDDDVIRIGTNILNSWSGRCAERESSAEVCIYNDVFKVDQCFGLLSCEALFLCNKDHSESLPNAPHHDKPLLTRFLKALHRTGFREECDKEDNIANNDHDPIEDIPPSSLTICRILDIFFKPDKLHTTSEVNADQQIQKKFHDDECWTVSNLKAIKDSDQDETETQHE